MRDPAGAQAQRMQGELCLGVLDAPNGFTHAQVRCRLVPAGPLVSPSLAVTKLLGSKERSLRYHFSFVQLSGHNDLSVVRLCRFADGPGWSGPGWLEGGCGRHVRKGTLARVG